MDVLSKYYPVPKQENHVHIHINVALITYTCILSLFNDAILRHFQTPQSV